MLIWRVFSIFRTFFVAFCENRLRIKLSFPSSVPRNNFVPQNKINVPREIKKFF
jgi:hypothetical protein